MRTYDEIRSDTLDYLEENKIEYTRKLRNEINMDNADRWQYATRKLRDDNIIKTERVNNFQNTYATGLTSEMNDTVRWQEVGPNIFNLLDYYFPEKKKMYLYVVKNGPLTTTELQSEFGYDKRLIIRFLDRLASANVIEKRQLQNGWANIYGLEKQFEDAGDMVYTTHIDTQGYTPEAKISDKLIQMLQIFREGDREYWKGHHFRDMGWRNTDISHYFGALNNLGLIERWSPSGPWVLTDKGKNIGVNELIEKNPKL